MANDLKRLSSPSFFTINRRKRTLKKGDYQNGTATDFSKKTEGNGEGEASQCRACKVVREEKEQLRKTQDRHKYMMGGCVVKYFPEAYDFSEQEMNRIIACAFSLKDVKNMIAMVLKERPVPEENNDEEEAENDDFDSDETEENDPEESDDDESGEA